MTTSRDLYQVKTDKGEQMIAILPGAGLHEVQRVIDSMTKAGELVRVLSANFLGPVYMERSRSAPMTTE